MFESLDENKKPNIGKLRYENPKKKEAGYFDPEAELTEEMWQKVIKYLNLIREPNNWDTFITGASWTKIAFPSRFGELKLTEDDWDVTRRKISSYINNQGGTLGTISNAKIIFPEHAEEIKDMLKKLKKDLYSSSRFYFIARDLKIIYPEITKFDGESALDASLQKEFDGKEWSLLVSLLCNYRIIFPDRKLPLKLGNDFWQYIRAYTKENCDRNRCYTFLYISASAKLIAAKEIKITDTSFEVIMPEESPELKEDIPKLPVIRKF